MLMAGVAAPSTAEELDKVSGSSERAVSIYGASARTCCPTSDALNREAYAMPAMNWKNPIKDLMPPIIWRSLRPPRTSYISAPVTIAAAHEANLSVCDYVERIWNSPGRSAAVIAKLHEIGAVFSATHTIVEIGAGTGRYIERTLKYCHPRRYQSYELDSEWSAWIAKTYPVEACHTDGRSLKSTSSNSG
jgi:hypothetical protein